MSKLSLRSPYYANFKKIEILDGQREYSYFRHTRNRYSYIWRKAGLLFSKFSIEKVGIIVGILIGLSSTSTQKASRRHAIMDSDTNSSCTKLGTTANNVVIIQAIHTNKPT